MGSGGGKSRIYSVYVRKTLKQVLLKLNFLTLKQGILFENLYESRPFDRSKVECFHFPSIACKSELNKKAFFPDHTAFKPLKAGPLLFS